MPVFNIVPTVPLGTTDLAEALQVRGALLKAEAHIPDALAQNLTSNAQPIPTSQIGDALIDTGASICGIDESAAVALGLNPVGQASIGGVGGSRQHNLYIARISFPGTHLNPSEWTLVGADLKAQNLLLLIGRDVLRNCVLVYNGVLGVTTISL